MTAMQDPRLLKSLCTCGVSIDGQFVGLPSTSWNKRRPSLFTEGRLEARFSAGYLAARRE